DGGTHEIGLKTALTKVFNDYAKNNGYLKSKDNKFEGPDVREGLTVILSLKVPENLLQFEGQTKSKLGSPAARMAVEAVVSEKLQFFLEENKAIAVDIISKALKGKMAREAARKAREEARKGKGTKKEKNLSDKLTPAQKKDPSKNELYLVEGDSAGGSAKGGRDRTFQAILPLRGKVINTEKARIEDIFKNAEINTMIYTIGAGVGSDFDINDCNYNKVIIMTDADDDGAHIQVLLLTFFYRYMRPLIENGRLFIALPPFYKVTMNKSITYVWTNEELEALTKGKSNYDVNRFKGLGEMDAHQLWDTTMNPETRSLIKVTITDAALAEKRVSVLMGDNVEPRKEWIDENVIFSLEDDFKIEK
ncbi:MAG: toprim domain-containing protein, partial [Bacilli bacterium]